MALDALTAVPLGPRRHLFSLHIAAGDATDVQLARVGRHSKALAGGSTRVLVPAEADSLT